MFRNLLLPVDLSDRHQPALDFARQLAGSQGKVVLLHVIEVIPGLSIEEDRPFYERLEKAAKKHLKRLDNTLTAQQISSRTEIRYGNRVEEIVQYAREAGTDLIILTTLPVAPADPTAGWGSLSYKVGLFAPCPVLLVK
jgi:nucleotide-binding universal stress UspA family protein